MYTYICYCAPTTPLFSPGLRPQTHRPADQLIMGSLPPWYPGNFKTILGILDVLTYISDNIPSSTDHERGVTVMDNL